MRDLFEKLTPPPRGLEGLREKLDDLDRRSSWSERLVFSSRQRWTTGVLGILALTGITYNVLTPSTEEAVKDYGIFQSVMAPKSREEVSLVPAPDQQITLVQLPSNNRDIKLYWIEESDD